MSLDFTVPGAFDKPPEKFFAPEIPPPPRPRPPRAPLPLAMAEAAVMYAEGRELDALRRLESAVKTGEVVGSAALSAWGGLFEVLQVLGRRAAFEALALTFARIFEKSPPAWNPLFDGAQAVSVSGDGGAQVELTGSLTAASGEVLKQAMKLAATSTRVHIDLGKLIDADNDGATLLLRAIAALKRAKKEFVLGSPERLAKILAAKAVFGERRGEAIWLLLLELYQLAFQQDAFEDTALNYALTFEVSPPSWEALPRRPDVGRPLAVQTAAKAEVFELRGRLLGVGAVDLAALGSSLAGRDECEIDARHLLRIDGVSARQLLDVLAERHALGKALRIIGLSPLVAAYLQNLGFADVAELRTRPL